MKKNLVFAICFCLLAGTSAGMAAGTHDSIVAFGNLTGNEADALRNFEPDNNDAIYDYFFEEYGIEALIWTEVADRRPTDSVLRQLKGSWNYIVVAYSFNNNHQWFMFRDDFARSGEAPVNNLGGDGLLNQPVGSFVDVLGLSGNILNFTSITGNENFRWWHTNSETTILQ